MSLFERFIDWLTDIDPNPEGFFLDGIKVLIIVFFWVAVIYVAYIPLLINPFFAGLGILGLFYKFIIKDKKFWFFEESKTRLHKIINISILIFGAVSLFFIFNKLFLSAFFFVPEKWGYHNEDREWVSRKDEIVLWLSILLSFASLFLMERGVRLSLRRQRKFLKKMKAGNV